MPTGLAVARGQFRSRAQGLDTFGTGTAWAVFSDARHREKKFTKSEPINDGLGQKSGLI